MPCPKPERDTPRHWKPRATPFLERPAWQMLRVGNTKRLRGSRLLLSCGDAWGWPSINHVTNRHPLHRHLPRGFSCAPLGPSGRRFALCHSSFFLRPLHSFLHRRRPYNVSVKVIAPRLTTLQKSMPTTKLYNCKSVKPAPIFNLNFVRTDATVITKHNIPLERILHYGR